MEAKGRGDEDRDACGDQAEVSREYGPTGEHESNDEYSVERNGYEDVGEERDTDEAEDVILDEEGDPGSDSENDREAAEVVRMDVSPALPAGTE